MKKFFVENRISKNVQMHINKHLASGNGFIKSFKSLNHSSIQSE